MGIFDKLFGKSESSSSTSNSMNDRADVWPAKFLTIAISETLNEAPGIDVVKEIITLGTTIEEYKNELRSKQTTLEEKTN